MRGTDLISLRAPYDFQGAALAAYNVERVRSYLEKNLGCSRKEICRDLNLCNRTVRKAIQKIRNK